MSTERLLEYPVHERPMWADANLPVSEAMDENGTQVVVSRYGDAVWDFWPQIRLPNTKVSQKRIDWAVKLPDGRSLLDPEHAPCSPAPGPFSTRYWPILSRVGKG
jgi:hypothetical protein